MSPTLLWFTLWVSMAASALSQLPAQTFFPASIPLANRSPYLSTWYSSTNDSSPLANSWPVFWDQQEDISWAGIIRVDGVSYEWIGPINYIAPSGTVVKHANVTNVQITPTRSIFTMEAGPMNLTITFLSPIEPSDWVLQSLPFSYLSLEASSLDGQDHLVQVYSDITAEWLSGNRDSSVMWTHNTTSSSLFHEIQLQSVQEGVEEVNQQAQDGISYYAITNGPGVTWQVGVWGDVRGEFNLQGSLSNNASTAFGPMQPDWMIFALALDLGTIQSTAKPVTWAVGYVRDPSIIYTAPDSTVQRLRPYFTTKYGTNIGAVIDDFLSGYDDALQRAIAFDQAVTASASAISPQYVDLVSLAARQTLSTLDITVSTGSDGKPNASDVRIFMKNIGEANSTTGRVNPVEGIYAALPALLYVNASLVGPLLAPLLDAQDSQTSTPPYAVQDLGLAYPHATGAHWPHQQGVEQSGNMLIMLYAHARFSGDGSLLRKHYSLAKRWADYLVDNTLTPTQQSTADNEGVANITNLAIKGIIAVKAMAQISQVLGEDSDSHAYDSQATALFGQWQSLALDKQHMLGVYNDPASWALMYNLYADRLLGTNIVNQTLLQNQTAFYKLLLSTSPAFGLKLDNTAQETSMAWLLFTAATALDNEVRDGLVHGAWARASSNLTMGAFPDHYDVQTGAVLGGSAGPAVGGVFSLLALNLFPKDILTTPSQSQPQSPGAGANDGVQHSRAPVGAIAGGVAGGIALIALVAAGVYCVKRRSNRGDRPPPKLDRSVPSPYTFLPQSQVPHTPVTNNGLEASSPRNNQTSYTEEAKTPDVSHPQQLSWAEPVSDSADVRLDSAGLASSRGLPVLPQGELQRADSGSRSAGSSAGMLGLRMEVENLRRVMQEIREERMSPPPEYTG